jgi:hypothetical protein
MRLPQWVSQHEQEVDPEIFKCKPSHSQGTHEETQTWDMEHTPKRKDSPIDQALNIVPELLIPALLPMQPVVHDPNMPNLIGDKYNNETIAHVFVLAHLQTSTVE